MRECAECQAPAKRKFCSSACRRQSQNRWHRQHYRTTRRFDKRWLANSEKKRKERKAHADPNIEREYHQERRFRFQGSRIWNDLPVQTLAQISNPRWKVILGGRCIREESWSELQNF